jgi:putative restriction endonuclease
MPKSYLDNAFFKKKYVKTPSKKWSEHETKLAMFLYFQLPFGQLHKSNPEIVKLATFLGRTPSSIAMKLANFASLDPKITETGRKGLDGASNLDRQVWQQFAHDWSNEAIAAEQEWNLIDQETSAGMFKENRTPFAFATFEGPTDAEAIIQRRLGQNFFRRAVLANFENKCCVTGVAEPQLLNASHIVPWNEDVKLRHNPANGLALIATFDRAFDRGLIMFDEARRLRLSPVLSSHSDKHTRSYFAGYDGAEMKTATRFDPSLEFMAWHRDNVFRG